MVILNQPVRHVLVVPSIVIMNGETCEIIVQKNLRTLLIFVIQSAQYQVCENVLIFMLSVFH